MFGDCISLDNSRRVLAAGFDPIGFGVYLVIIVELSQITPPVGFSLFVIQGISNEPVSAIIKATVHFFLLMILAVVLIAIWPDIVMYLSNQMSKESNVKGPGDYVSGSRNVRAEGLPGRVILCR